MKKFLSFIISASIFVTVLPPVVSYAKDIDYPKAGNEMGYIFMLSDNSESVDVEKYPNIIEVTSELAKIYFAEALEDIQAISDIYDIECVEENIPLAKPEPIDITDEVSLYSLGAESVSLFAETENEEVDDTSETTASFPNDPLYQYQWSHEAIKVKAFWDNGITGEGVKVGIIDSGINRNHIAFDGVNIATGINVSAYVAKDEENLYDTSDDGYHGTCCASIICSAINDSVGMAGLTDKITLIPYRVNDSRYADYINGAASIQAIDLAYKDGCDVLSISMGAEQYSEVYETLIDKAAQNGMIICAATGNSGNKGNPIEYPAAFENVIGVGGVVPPEDIEKVIVWCDPNTGEILGTRDDEKYINYVVPTNTNLTGSCNYTTDAIANIPDNSYIYWDTATANESVFVSAPAYYMIAACATVQKNNKTPSDEAFITTFGGTSAATPIVAAAAIGVKQMRPYVDVDMFKEILKETAVDLDEPGYDINTGYGMVNFERIYDYVSQMPESIPKTIPNIAINYENKTLTGFEGNESYTINGEDITLDDTLSLPIREEWFGTTIEVVTKSISDAYIDSEPQTLVIPSCSAPTGLIGETNAISGTTSDMQYRKVGATTWSNAKDGTTSCSVGVYEVRYKLSDTSFASEIAVVQVGLAVPNVAIDYRYERLKSFERGENYMINGEDITLNTVYCPIKEEWFGTTVEIVRKASDKYMNDSEPQLLEIPARPEAPNVILFTDNIVNLTSEIQYKEENAAGWKNGKNDITLEQGKTYSFRVQYTSNSFASEIRHITVQLAETERYEIETDITYENGICTYSAVNNTIWNIPAIGIIAVYSYNGELKYLETVNEFPTEGFNKSMDYELSSGDTVKFLVWDCFESLKPKDNTKLSYYTVE